MKIYKCNLTSDIDPYTGYMPAPQIYPELELLIEAHNIPQAMNKLLMLLREERCNHDTKLIIEKVGVVREPE